jgi:hypothetical protein
MANVRSALAQHVTLPLTSFCTTAELQVDAKKEEAATRKQSTWTARKRINYSWQVKKATGDRADDGQPTTAATLLQLSLPLAEHVNTDEISHFFPAGKPKKKCTGAQTNPDDSLEPPK